MAQGFKFAVENTAAVAVTLKGDYVDKCINSDPSEPDVPTGPYTTNTGTGNKYLEVVWDCDNGLYKIEFTPTTSQEGQTTGYVTLNFDKSTDKQNPYGIITIQDSSPAIVTQYKDQESNKTITTEIAPSLTLSNDTGDQWAIGTVTLNQTTIES